MNKCLKMRTNLTPSICWSQQAAVRPESSTPRLTSFFVSSLIMVNHDSLRTVEFVLELLVFRDPGHHREVRNSIHFPFLLFQSVIELTAEGRGLCSVDICFESQRTYHCRQQWWSTVDLVSFATASDTIPCTFGIQ